MFSVNLSPRSAELRSAPTRANPSDSAAPFKDAPPGFRGIELTAEVFQALALSLTGRRRFSAPARQQLAAQFVFRPEPVFIG